MRFNELTEQRVQEGGMPSSIIRVKEKIRLMTDAEKKEYFKGKTREQLVSMARSHGYGENSNVYAKYISEGLNEFAPSGDRGESGDDPYKYPQPEQYSRSIDFFGKFEADHFDREDMNDATGEFKGYWNDGGKPRQIAYFKFDNPQRTGGDHPGMGWYYEPESISSSDNANVTPAVDNSAQRKQQELGMIRAFLKSGRTPSPGSQIYNLMKRHGVVEGQLDEFQLNPTGLLASVIRWAVNNPVLITAVGAAGLASASAATAGLALGPIMTLVSTGQVGLGLLTLDKLMNMINTNPNQAEGYIKKYIYKYIGDETDVQEFEKLHAQTAYKGETEFRWRAEVWPVTIDKNESERWLEKYDKYWLDTYNKEQADKEQAAAQQSKPPAAPQSQQDLASTVPPYIPPTRPTESVKEARATGRASWDSNMTGYQGDYGGAENWGRRSREDDEHHEIDRRMEQEHEHRNTHGTWYVRVDGQVIPKSYTGKAAANAAALEFKKQPGNENKLIMLTMREQ